MSSTKILLKETRDKLYKKDFAGARDAAERILDFEPSHYTAHVFLGLALLELGEYERSERVWLNLTQMYRAAIDLDPDQPLARQGLAKFYERTNRWDQLDESFEGLINVFVKAEDVIKLAETVQKRIDLQRNHGTKLQLGKSLMALLPGSSAYPLLSTLPEPDTTNPASSAIFPTQAAIYNSLPILEEVVAILENEEESQFSKNFNARRTRLGAPKPDRLKKDIDREICEASTLPDLYRDILNHPRTSDEVRSQTDAKLIRYKQRHLYSIPSMATATKQRLLAEFEDLVNGTVLLGHPDELAWIIYLEWMDYEDVVEIDASILKRLITLFPELPLSGIVKGYLLYSHIPLSDDPEEAQVDAAQADAGLDLLLNAPLPLSRSVLTNRILSEVYLDVEDYGNASKIAKKGLSDLAELENNTGKRLRRTRVGLQVILATCLVHLHPPKYHAQASALIDEVLHILPQNVKSLMGRGYIFEFKQEWLQAKESFDQVASFGSDSALALRALEESAWCESLLMDYESAIAHLQDILQQLQYRDGHELDVARCLWRLGQSYWNLGGSRREQAYQYFIAALKKDSTYAPAFTSLGLYYLDHASPPDPVRASKCFQKAFELDPLEAVAAKHLAEGFAKEREWDLVEVVARRTIEGEGRIEGGLANDEDEQSPTNAWAWKALGVIELNRQHFPEAIHAFQLALRAEPDDQNLWLQLGEAYTKAGRYAASIKALERSYEMKPDEWLSLFFIASAKQGIGLYTEAIATYQLLHEERPSELGILISLAQAYLNLGITELNQGFRSRAEFSLVSVANIALRIISEHPGFRSIAWKLITDAAFHLSCISSFDNEETVLQLAQAICALLPPNSDLLQDVVPRPDLEVSIGGSGALQIAIFSAENRISLSTSKLPDPSAWYDLGMTLHSWAIQHTGQEKMSNLITKCFTEALQHDYGNDSYWAALGIAHFSSNARAAQHCFIKALDIDSKNAVTWGNLGFLYMHYEDRSLAQEAFERAQVLDPDFTLAWIGQALIADANGDAIHATALFAHATTLDQPIPEADYQTGSRTFEAVNSKPLTRTKAIEGLLPAFFLLNRYCSRRQDDATGLHLFSLVCERLGHVELSRELVDRAIRILERLYEDTEDPVVERQFMIANATLGRLNLACGDPEASLPSFETVLGLLQDDDQVKRRLETQARLGIGIAQSTQEDFAGAVSYFQEAQRLITEEDHTLRGQASIVLAKTLWSLGTSEFREMAKTELLQCISEDPNNLSAINVLAGMGILSSDEGLVDASVSEIVGLPPDQKSALDSEGNVDYLLIQYQLSQGNIKEAVTIAQKGLFADPSNIDRRNALALLALKSGSPSYALALLRGHKDKLQAGSKSLILDAVAQTLVGGQEALQIALRSAQAAIMLEPRNRTCWQILAYVRKVIDTNQSQ